MNPVDLNQGGMINGQLVDPVTLLFHALRLRFGPLTEETRLMSLVEMLNVNRQGHESIDELYLLGLKQLTIGQKTKQISACHLRH